MKKQVLSKKVIIPAISLAVLGTAIGGGIFINKSNADDVPPIVQQVQHNTEELDNHEARITNAENNIKDLQTNTGTSPSSSNTTPPVVTTPSTNQPLPSQQNDPNEPNPITIISSSYLIDGTKQGNWCSVKYSDSSRATLPAKYGLNSSSGYNDNCEQYLGQVKD